MRKEKVTRAILASRPNSSPVHARAYMAKPAQQQPSSRRHTPRHDRPLSSPLAATNAWTPLVIPYPRTLLCFLVKQSTGARLPCSLAVRAPTTARTCPDARHIYDPWCEHLP